MAEFTIYDKTTGAVLSHLNCSAEDLVLNVGPGQGCIEGHVDAADRVENGRVIAGGAAEQSTPGYAERRAAAYPSIADQLDAIWKGGIDFNVMRDRIADVKTQHPKED